MRGRSALQAVRRTRERVRERTKKRERPRNAGEGGQFILPLCSLDVTYIVAGVCDMQVRISIPA